MSFSVAGYINVPSVRADILVWREQGATWPMIAEQLEQSIGQKMTGNAVRKAWNARMQEPENVRLNRMNATAYLSIPENLKHIDMLRNRKQQDWPTIARYVSEQTGATVSANAVQKAWSAMVQLGYDIKQSTRSQDVILNADIHWQIGVMKNINMMSWKDINRYIRQRYGYKMSAHHLETVWHEGAKQGMRVPTRYGIRDFVRSVSGQDEIKMWLNEQKTWLDIANILKIRFAHDVTPRAVREYHNEVNKNDSDMSELKRSILNSYHHLHKMRYIDIASWPRIALWFSEKYSEKVEPDIIKDVVVGHMNYLKSSVVREEQRKEKRIMANGQKFSIKSYMADSDNRAEIKMWLERMQWKDIVQRISQRVGVEISVSMARNAY